MEVIETDIRREGRPWGDWRDERLREMATYDMLYNELTGEHLPEFLNAVARNPQAGIVIEQQTNSSSSSSQSAPQRITQQPTLPQQPQPQPPPPPQQRSSLSERANALDALLDGI